MISTYSISSRHLRPCVQYIIFNHSADPQDKRCITAFANNNICLGIIRGKKIKKLGDDAMQMEAHRGITFYFTGMYMKPCEFSQEGCQDEICIDFTPAGFYSFFPFNAKTFIAGDHLDDILGTGSHFFFESVFNETDFTKRGQMIENFLLKKLQANENPFLAETLHHFDYSHDETKLHEISRKMRCSEKKIYRLFTNYFDVSPKDYSRIVRFRKVLWNLNHHRSFAFQHLANGVDYFDQSHLIREFQFFTGKSPSKFSTNFECVDNKIIFEVR
ncbi:hypothetical protein WSM22_24450 [Cytophagales bacterium WSM2-2]|nr:hypothetical protein WSM22_24450 [Cytophagales bacterium WSM2-2]